MSRTRAKRSLGQNFLVDDSISENIVRSLALSPTDTVVEIGPGQGALTGHLIKNAGRVIAVEFDRDLIPTLNSRFANEPKLEIVNEDALTVDFAKLLAGAGEAKLVANLPYNISTPILQRLMEHRHLFTCLVLMFQKEVIERITARPGSSDRGYLTVLAENAFDIEFLFTVPPTAFRPVPKVWSGVIRLTPRVSEVEDDKAFRSLLSRAFGQKRKTILNNLRSALPDAAATLAESDIDPGRRAETLTLDEWVRLTNAINKKPDVRK